MAGKGEKLIAENRRARHDYHLLDRFEAGVQLTGTEVKSLRDGRVTLGQAYADLRNGEVWLIGAHIDEYAQGNVANHEPERDRKLLLHRREIESLIGQVQQKGLTLVPTRMYFKNGRVKLELAVGRGKEQRDKRRDIAKRDAQRDIERLLVPVLAYVLEAETARERERRFVLRADRGDEAPDAVLAGSPVDQGAHHLGRVAAATVRLEDRVADLDGVGRLDGVDARRSVEAGVADHRPFGFR